MKGFHFSQFDPSAEGKTTFEQLLDIFMQLLTYTNGDVSEAMSWMNELDKEYKLTNEEYGMGDFIDELKEKGYIDETSKMAKSRSLQKQNRESARKVLEEIFGKLKKTKTGQSHTFKPGRAMNLILKQGLFNLAIRWSR